MAGFHQPTLHLNAFKCLPSPQPLSAVFGGGGVSGGGGGRSFRIPQISPPDCSAAPPHLMGKSKRWALGLPHIRDELVAKSQNPVRKIRVSLFQHEWVACASMRACVRAYVRSLKCEARRAGTSIIFFLSLCFDRKEEIDGQEDGEQRSEDNRV